MPSLDENLFREIIMDHYQNPRNRQLTNSSLYDRVNMDSQTCIDNIDVEAKIENNIISDIRFDGEACAISTASTSIMIELLKGKTIDEADLIIENYFNMIYGKEYDPDILEEAIAFMNTYKQANRIKCATLGWNAIKQIIDKKKVGD